MPMDFPDMESLKRCAEAWNFRNRKQYEHEDDYRAALADFVEPKDFIESCEIRNKVGWDKFNLKQQHDMIRRKARES